MSNRLGLYNGNTTNSILQTKYPATETTRLYVEKSACALSVYIISYT